MEFQNQVSAFCDDVLADRDGVALSALIRSGDISAKEVVSAAINRAKAVNPSLNAISTENFEEALSLAESHKIGDLNQVFSGLPTFIKDNDHVQGLPTRQGSRATSNAVSKYSSRFVKEYLSLGLINLGKSTLPEFGLTATTEPLLDGATRNPWNTDYSCGGSSGGSAALVAAGVVPIAHGNDGGGSIRIPAACCGLVGLKSTRGRLANMQGTESMPINLVHQGVLTRSVRDTAAFFAAAEKVYKNPGLPEIGHVERPSKQRLRIGFFTLHPNGQSIDLESRDATLQAARLCESLGHKVEEIASPVAASLEFDFKLYWGMLAFSLNYFGHRLYGEPFDRNQLEPFTRGLSKFFLKNMVKLPFSIRRLKAMAKMQGEIYQRFDILLSPVQAHPIPKIGYFSADLDPESTFQLLSNYVPFTQEQNVTGAPAISLPMGLSQTHLPLGVQYAAAFGQDRRLLELALELEEASDWSRVGMQKLVSAHSSSVKPII